MCCYNTNGYDELTTLSKNKFIEITKKGVSKVKILDPLKFGFKNAQKMILEEEVPMKMLF